MTQSIAVVTLGSEDLDRSIRFYAEGFGWKPIFRNDEIAFYQMNGLVFATWKTSELEKDMRSTVDSRAAAFALAHNVFRREDVSPLLNALIEAGGSLLRAPDEPPHGGYRGYVADPDGHAWEIAWNPHWPISDNGAVSYAV